MEAPERPIPPAFRRKIERHYGERAQAWFESLPGVLAACEEKWDVRLEDGPLDNLSYNYIIPGVRRDGRRIVVKAGLPHEKELFTEMEALRLFAARGAVELLESDRDLAAMLLERLDPGTTLRQVQERDDAEATRLAAPLLREVRGPLPVGSDLPSVADWAQVLQRVKPFLPGSPMRPAWVERAADLVGALHPPAAQAALIHGDLHHDNIVNDTRRGWLAIDPKGLVGDPAYNAARFLNNWWGTPPTSAAVEQRLRIIADATGFTAERLACWGFVDCVIGNSWTLEDGHADYLWPHLDTYLGAILPPYLPA